MEKENLFTLIILLETLTIPIVFGLSGTGMISELLSKLLLIAILISMFTFVYIAVKSLKSKKKRISYYLAFFIITLTWNTLITFEFILYGFTLCPNCP
jgi:hypothetical protein